MAGDAFQRFKDSTNRAITTISVKTSSTLEKSKIKMHIESLTKEVFNMSSDVGEEVYLIWTQGKTSFEEVVSKLEEIQKKKSEIERLAKELDSIDDRDNEILGTKPVINEEETFIPACPNCGYEVGENAKFCRKCGYKL